MTDISEGFAASCCGVITVGVVWAEAADTAIGTNSLSQQSITISQTNEVRQVVIIVIHSNIVLIVLRAM